MRMEKSLPAIPAKRYFTIGEVSELCGVKPYVLRYWEQEFSQLKPMKRRGNRRYYQHHEVLLIRRIRELLYDQGFTISGARNRLLEAAHGHGARVIESMLTHANGTAPDHGQRDGRLSAAARVEASPIESTRVEPAKVEPREWPPGALSTAQMRQELISIRGLLTG